MPIILQINVTANWGSHGRIAEQIGIMAMEDGWESYIAYGRHMTESKSHLIRIGNSLEICLHGLEAKLLGHHGRGSVLGTKKFIQNVKEIKPDVIHLHNIPGYYVNYKLLFEFLSVYDRPVIWTLHDCWPFTGRCTHFIKVGCYKWKTGCHDCEFKKIYPDTWFWDRSASDYRLKKKLFTKVSNLTVVPVSEWLAGFVKESFLKEQKIEMIHNGTDLNLFCPQSKEANLDNKFTIVGVASQWGQGKGYEDFVQLRRMLPEGQYNIVMIGLNDTQLSNLPKGIKGVKRTNSVQELATFYALADVFLNPTYVDNFPTVNIEALACGTPVITYNTGGSPEAVDGETGFVVEQGDLSGVIEAINVIKTKGKEAFSFKCRQRAEKEFDMKKQFQRYIDLYNKNL